MGDRPIKKPKEKSAAFLNKGGAPVPSGSIDHFPPAFSFEKMQDGSGSSFNCCEDGDQVALARRIFMLSRTPWSQIRQAPRTGFGAEQIKRSSIKLAVPPAVTEDVTFFYALHHIGNKRFVGYRIGQIFHILWVDHTFKVYDHGS